MTTRLRLRQAATILRQGHQTRPAPAELADLLDRIDRADRSTLPLPPTVVDAAHRLVTAMTTVPADEDLDPRLTDIEYEATADLREET